MKHCYVLRCLFVRYFAQHVQIPHDQAVIIVLYPKKGVCADPVDEGAILGEGGGSPIVMTRIFFFSLIRLFSFIIF